MRGGKTLRLVLALVAIGASAGCVLASLLDWLTIDQGASISGWGTIRGGQPEANGTNINDTLSSLTTTTFRPGAMAVVVGGFSLLAAVGIAVMARGDKPHRIPASVLALCGVGGVIWGTVKGFAPGNLDGVLGGNDYAAGAGPWVLAGCSLVLLAIAVIIFFGVLDPPRPPARGGRSRR